MVCILQSTTGSWIIDQFNKIKLTVGLIESTSCLVDGGITTKWWRFGGRDHVEEPRGCYNLIIIDAIEVTWIISLGYTHM